MQLADWQIRALCEVDNGMIVPFYNRTTVVNDKSVIPFGLSSYGYDIRVGHTWSRYSKDVQPLDPKNTSITDIVTREADYYDIPPGDFVLCNSMEWFNIPRNVIAICLGKSTYARLGLIVNVTPLEPEWSGHLTIELSNTAKNPLRVYGNEGICQLIFFATDAVCETSYADRKGKYQNQANRPILPLVTK